MRPLKEGSPLPLWSSLVLLELRTSACQREARQVHGEEERRWPAPVLRSHSVPWAQVNYHVQSLRVSCGQFLVFSYASNPKDSQDHKNLSISSSHISKAWGHKLSPKVRKGIETG